MSLIKQKLTGNTIIFDRDHMYLLEGSWKPGDYKKIAVKIIDDRGIESFVVKKL